MAKARARQAHVAEINSEGWTLRLSSGWDAAIKGALVTAALTLIITAFNVWRTQGIVIERLRVQDESLKSIEVKITNVNVGVGSLNSKISALDGYVRAKHGDLPPSYPKAVMMPYAEPVT